MQQQQQQHPHAATRSAHQSPPPPLRPFTLVLITPPDLAAPNSRQFDAEVRAVRALFSDAGLPRLHLRKPGADPAHVASYLSALAPEHRRRVVVHGAAVAGAPLAVAVAPFAARGELGGVHYTERDRTESARRGHAFLEGAEGEEKKEDGGARRRRRLLRSSGYHSLAAAGLVLPSGGGGGGASTEEAEAAGGGGDEQEQEEENAQKEPWPAEAYLDYCFLSPVYDSISKAGYRSAGFLAPGPKAALLARALARPPLPVLALGGVAPGTLRALRGAGFAGAAVLGAVWQAAGKGGDVVGAYRRLADEAERGL